ncbi:CRP-like cAMP-activated global transcriptional regulator [Roseobacter fucihabitans]|uniref:CRP-like cAMP-activated global transcriptional regulator n=1 Tax=Roseobacter fucihabitans TaxID=1537242 RepID=A0ABZ2C0G2_9RHOB|nr:Crp/Fnr family transcriptional regulator [Roseobacter litoralis]MBC6967778.1 cAMP receptor protein [Roseobacter litoralis]
MSPWKPATLATIEARAARINVPDATCLFSPGSRAENFFVVLSGTLRVEQTSSGGRSIVLYRVTAGQSCVMTTSGLLCETPYTSYGYAEGPVEALSLGQNAFRSLLATDPDFRAATFAIFSERLIELTHVIDELLLHRLDQKLAQMLLDRCRDKATLRTTHQAVAAELGTAREVISRTLKDFERRGWVALARAEIKVLAPADLERFAQSR